MKRIYLAGPMTGLPEFNYPAFHAEAARLRALGYQVENPAENPPQDGWEDYMKQAIPQLLTCDLMALLPGWEKSKGAMLEHHIACNLGILRVMAADIGRRAMAHEQLQDAQRAALSLGLNINSEQAAAIINAALRMQQEADPVAYVLFRDGEVFYETEDNIVISNKPGDSSDLYQWLPVYTAAAALKPDELTHCACGDAYPATSYGAGFIDGSGMCPNCDAAIPAVDIHTPAARDVMDERQRQIEAEGWTPEHDDEHKYPSDLGIAAACYALCACGEAPHVVFGIERFPWPGKGCGEGRTGPSTKGGSRRMLVKAGALILAEIERRDRAEGKEPSHG